MKFRLSLILCLSSLAFAQGVAVGPQTALQTLNGFSRPLGNATITVCAANASGIPCAPALASTIFANSALTQSLSNPFTADANGNYVFYVAPGTQYTVTVSAPNYSGYSYQVSPGIGNGVTPGASIQPSSLNGIKFASQFSGADCGAKIATALASSGEVYLDSACASLGITTPFTVSGLQHVYLVAGATFVPVSAQITISCSAGPCGISGPPQAMTTNASPNAGFQMANGVNLSPMISVTGSYAILRDLVIDGNLTNNSTAGDCVKVASGASRVNVENVTVGNCKTNGIEIDGPSPKILHLMTYQNGNDGLLCNGNGDAFVTDSEFEANQGNGIELQNCPAFQITHSDVSQNAQGAGGSAGIYVWASTGFGSITPDIEYVRFGANYKHDIRIDGATNALGPTVIGGGITHNHFSGSVNLLAANTYDNVLINGGGPYNITENQFGPSNVGNSQKCGIELDDVSGNPVAPSNVVPNVWNYGGNSWGTKAYCDNTSAQASGLLWPLPSTSAGSALALGLGASGSNVQVGLPLQFRSGLGAISQLVFPSDQPGQIATQNNQNILFAPNGNGIVQSKAPVQALSINGAIEANQDCTTPGTLDDTCLTNAINNSNNLHIHMGCLTFTASCTYTFTNPVLIRHQNHIYIDIDPNVTIAGAGGYSNQALIQVAGASYNITINGHRYAKFDCTNVNGGNSGNACINVTDYLAQASNLTQPGANAACGSGNVSANAGAVCATLTSADSNFSYMNNGATYVSIFKAVPNDWNNAADLANCVNDNCPVPLFGPVTFTDSTHFWFDHDSDGNVIASGIPAFCSACGSAQVQYAGYDITVTGVECANSPQHCIAIQATAGSSSPLMMKEVTASDNWVHNSGNTGIYCYNAVGAAIVHNKVELTTTGGGIQEQDCNGALIAWNELVYAFTAPGTAIASSGIRAGFSSGGRYSHNLFRNGGNPGDGAAATSFQGYLWCDTCLKAVISDNTFLDGGNGVRAEVNEGTVIKGNQFQGQGVRGILATWRKDVWPICTFNTLACETNTFTPPGYYQHVIPAQTPVAPNANVTLANDSSQHTGTNTASLHVTTTGTVPQYTAMWYVNAPQEMCSGGSCSPTTYAPSAYSCTNADCTVTIPSNSAFSTVPAASSFSTLVATNTVYATGNTPSCLNGIWAVKAKTSTTVEFITSSCTTASGSSTGGTVQPMATLQLYGYPVRSILAHTSVTINTGTYAFCTSSALNLDHPEECFPWPEMGTTGWWAPRFIDPYNGARNSQVQSFGMVCVQSGGCPTGQSFWIQTLTNDIPHSENLSITGNSFTDTGWQAIDVKGDHITVADNTIRDAGFGSEFSGSTPPDCCVGIYLDTVTYPNNDNVNINDVSISGNTIYNTFAQISSNTAYAAIKANASGGTINGINIGTNNINQSQWGAGQAYQLSSVADTVWYSKNNQQVLTADSAGITATTAATAVTEFTWPALATNYKYVLHCAGSYIQATGNAAVGIAIQSATGSPTNLVANGTIGTGATGVGVGSSGNITTTTYTSVLAPTGAAFGTQLPWSLDAVLETGSTSPTLNVGFYTGNSSDAVTVKRDSSCTLTQQ